MSDLGFGYTKQEQQELRRLLQSGLQPVRTVLRALALRQLAEGQVIASQRRGVNAQRDRMANQQTLSARRPRAGLVRAGAAGRCWMRSTGNALWPWCVVRRRKAAQRWTVRLLTEEVVKRKLVPRVGRETIRVLLESHDLKPWREKNVVRGGTG